jgi:hypothetical protein
MKVLYCPQVSIKFWQTRAKAILDTWGASVSLVPNLNNEGYFGSPRSTTKFILELERDANDYDWYALTCDDVYIWTDRLEAELSGLPNNICHGWMWNYVGDAKIMPECTGHGSQLPVRYPSGCCATFSRDAMMKIAEYLRTQDMPGHCVYTDVALGMWSRACGVNLYHSDRFDVDGLQQNDPPGSLLVCHRVTCDNMRKIHANRN